MVQVVGPRDYLNLLERWLPQAKEYLYDCPDRPELTCYGTGENGWGVQTNQKAFAAFAVVASHPDFDPVRAGMTQKEALEIALRLLRYSLASHLEGFYHCTDGTSWGHTWISVLGVERMMHGVAAIEQFLTSADKELLRKVLISESDWLLDYEIVAGLLAKDGRNKPESNLWNGALLYRTAEMYPDNPNAARYKQKGNELFANSISIPSDLTSDVSIDGRKISELHKGANFFESYALNHHGYLNVGYMVICLSNMAMLHFMYRQNGLQAPDLLYHHVKGLWQLIKACTFADGRLLRIGGDTRVRYTYCQDYAIPMWLMIMDLYGEDECRSFEIGWLKQVEHEMSVNGDGSFLSERCEYFQTYSPLYYTRLDSDRAVTLSMGLAWKALVREAAAETAKAVGASTTEAAADTDGITGTHNIIVTSDRTATTGATANAGVTATTGVGQTTATAIAAAPATVTATAATIEATIPMLSQWHDEYHGAYLQRSEKRIASWTWGAVEMPQGLCLPANGSNMAEWKENLSGQISGLGKLNTKRVETHEGSLFSGGFITWGKSVIHSQGFLGEGQKDDDIAYNRTVCAVLPDETHMLVLQYAAAVDKRIFLTSVKGLYLHMPNDLFNANHRNYYYEAGLRQLSGYGSEEAVVSLHSNWLNIDDQLGVIAAYGSKDMAIYRPGRRQIGLKETMKSQGMDGMLYCDEICGTCNLGLQSIDANGVIFDAGYVLQAGEGHKFTKRYAADQQLVSSMYSDHAAIRGIRIKGVDLEDYRLVANFGKSSEQVSFAANKAVDLATGEQISPNGNGELTISLEAGQAKLFRC